jgi:uncharacterized NAD-dependent epimerase/dehydratase family protein
MPKNKIAIIDSGVNVKHPAFSKSKPVLICDEERYEVKNFYGHGTAIYNIIKKVEDIAEITNFKLNNVESGVCEDELINILTTIKNEYNFDIINLSLGISICEEIDRLYSVCKALTESGTIIVSAFDNTGSISYPAAFENVIGVTSGQSCFRINDFEYIQDTIVNLGAKGDIQKLAWNNPDYILLGGNSFACAHVTVQVAKLMFDGIFGLDNILQVFKDKAKKHYLNESMISLKNNQSIPFLIKKAVIFPFNKEMHSLIRFAPDLKFEIVGVYDSKYSANVGSTTDHIMKSEVRSIPIQNIAQIKWDSFDTLILGHLDEMSSLINKHDLQHNLIKTAISKKKNVYAFDDVTQFITSPNIYSPKVLKKDLPPYRFGKLHRLSKPIIGVYGTSSRQGKFTLQLELRKFFQSAGYKIGQIGTEPSSLLYGMDYVYPMGYNNSVYIQDYEVIRYLNSLMADICKKDVDLIITGSQSGVLPYDTGNLAQFSLPQIDFLLGTQPDAVVLCINPYDELEYVMRTKQFIESSVDCKVVALVMFPMDLKDDWTGIYGRRVELNNEKYTELLKAISEKFSMPVYKLGNKKDIDMLGESIIEYFDQSDELEISTLMDNGISI